VNTFTFGAARSWVLRLFGRHPLVRVSDRIEAFATALAVLVAVLAVPVVAAIGTSVHDSRARFYAEQMSSRHQVTATAVEDSAMLVRSNTVSFVVRARWNASGANHVSTIAWPERAKAGDQTNIWVDAHGDNANVPAAPGQAGLDAVGAAVSLWLGIVFAAAAFAFVVRWRLDRVRFAAWDRELRSPVGGDSAGDGGGRPNRP
jgi:hypothetical protein